MALFKNRKATLDDKKCQDATHIKSLRQEVVEAVYHNPAFEPEEYRDNPFILALPPYSERESVIKAIKAKLAFPHSETARNLPVNMKYLCLDRVFRNFCMQPEHILIYDWIQARLRSQYHDHLSSFDPHRVKEAYVRIQSGVGDVIRTIGQAHSRVLFIFGCSGVGKTSAAQIGLINTPNIIVHENFGGKGFQIKQVVWIHVTVPHNGSIDTLCRSILQWFDNRLGTAYEDEMHKKRINSGDYVEKVILVLQHHNVGLVVIDEIQNALRASDKVAMLDMLVNLLNGKACAVVAIGTPEAESLVSKRFRLSRRVGSEVVRFRPFEPGDLTQFTNIEKSRALTSKEIVEKRRMEDRDRYLSNVTRVDFLPESPMSPSEVADALLRVSAGVPAFISIAWGLTQYWGLRNKSAMVTPELVHVATEEAFSLVKGLLKALREKDYVMLDRVGDMALGRIWEHFENSVSSKDRGLLDCVDGEDKRAAHFAQVVGALINLGIGEAHAEVTVQAIQREAPGLASAELTRRALDRICGLYSGGAGTGGEAPLTSVKQTTAQKKPKDSEARRAKGARASSDHDVDHDAEQEFCETAPHGASL